MCLNEEGSLAAPLPLNNFLHSFIRCNPALPDSFILGNSCTILMLYPLPLNLSSFVLQNLTSSSTFTISLFRKQSDILYGVDHDTKYVHMLCHSNILYHDNLKCQHVDSDFL